MSSTAPECPTCGDAHASGACPDGQAGKNFCVHCGQPLRPPGRFCTNCGKAARTTPVPGAPSGIRCPSCGEALKPGARHCSSCGGGAALTDPFAKPPPAKRSTRAIAPLTDVPPRPAFADPTDPMGSITTMRPTGERGPTFPLALFGTTTIGRTDADVAFSEDRYISPRHVELEGGGEGVMLRDAGSVNGTFLRLRQPATVSNGCVLLLGRQVLRVRCEEPAAPQIAADGTCTLGSAARAATWAVEQVASSGRVRDVFHLPPAGCLVGRDRGDLRFPQDTFVSGEHTSMLPKGAKLEVRDLGSANGTWIRLASPYRLRKVDEVIVGLTILHFHVPMQ